MATLRRPTTIAASVLAAALVAWVVTIERMRGMDAGPGTDLGALGWFVGIWVTMMAAMMLPSAAPMVLMFARVSRERSRSREARAVPTWTFVGGYLLAWTLYGLFAFAVWRGLRSATPSFFAWSSAGPWIAGGALAAAGAYQLTPLKSVCLRRCRSPLSFVLGAWREGRGGALLMGLEHGAFCVGCCWGLMSALFALGVMSLFWMTVVAAVIYAEKTTFAGERLALVLAVVLVVLGIWVAAAPASVPGLTQPHGLQMRMK